MNKKARPPNFSRYRPASTTSSRVASANSNKTRTRCEIVLRRRLKREGLAFEVNVRTLPGVPDIVFRRQKIAVFCDGDFWHGRSLKRRLSKLARGHNPEYWIDKIRYNVARDKLLRRRLRAEGWRVFRCWETDVLNDCDAVVARLRREFSA